MIDNNKGGMIDNHDKFPISDPPVKVKVKNEFLIEQRDIVVQGDLLVAKTIEDVRGLDQEYIDGLVGGKYKGVQVLGYYEEGDTPASIIYYLSDTTAEDDGGSVIDVGGIKLEHEFNNIFNIKYFGAIGDNNFNNTDVFNRILSAHKRGKIIIPIGVFGIYETIEIPDGSQIIFQGEGRNSGNGAPNGVADGLSMITWLGENLDYTEAIRSDDQDNCWCEFNNFHLNNRTQRKDVDGLKLYKFIRGAMNDVVIARFKSNFVITNWSYYMTIYNSQFSYGWDCNVLLTEQPNHASFNSCRFLLSDGDGFRINNGQTGVTFNSCYFERNLKSAISVRNTRVLNVNSCYFEQNGTQGDKTTSNINVQYYDNNVNVDTIVNILGGYAYFRDGIDFVRVVSSPTTNFGDITVNIEGSAFTARNFIQDKNTTSANLLSALVRVTTANSGLLSKVSVSLANNGNVPADNGLGVLLPIGGRPFDYKSFMAENCNVTKATRPEWDDTSRNTLKEELYVPNINFLGANGNTDTTKNTDFPALTTANGFYNLGRNTATSGDLLMRFYNNTLLTSWINVKTGEGVFNKLRLGTGANNPTINYHTTNPEGVITATTGSLCLVTGVTGNNVYHKSTGTSNTGWVLLTPPPNATPTVKGLVNQSANVTDITTADATDLDTVLVLINELKSKLNAKLIADRASGQQATT